jgi:HK97 family phage major capsid protein
MKKIEIQIIDEIGIDTQLKDVLAFKDQIEKADEITLLINSHGGSVFEGIAIYNLLKPYQKKITSRILGIAGSAASVIALAGSRLEMFAGSVLMIHDPWMGTVGDAETHEKSAEILEKIASELVAIYATETGLTEEEVRALMKKESWLTAKDLQEMGIDVEIIDVRGMADIIAASGKKNIGGEQMNEQENAQLSVEKKIDQVLDQKIKTLIDQVVDAKKKVEVQNAYIDSSGYLNEPSVGRISNAGEFVAYAMRKPQEVKALVSRETDATDGLSIPKIYLEEIQQAIVDDQILYSRAFRFGGTLGTLQAPMLNQGGTNGPEGGYLPTYKAEGADLDTVDPKLSELLLTPRRLGFVTNLSNKILNVAPAIQAQIVDLARNVLGRTMEKKFVSGTGTNEPQGIIGASATINVTRDTANDVKEVDLATMASKLLPASRSAFWLASVDTMAKINTIADNSKGKVAYIQGQLYAFGYPVYFTTIQPALGTAGDVLLVDASAYAIHEGLGLEIAFSPEAGFKASSVSLRVEWAHDAKPRIVGPITWATGKTVSAFVRLG